jgi:hypothetical protein
LAFDRLITTHLTVLFASDRAIATKVINSENVHPAVTTTSSVIEIK